VLNALPGIGPMRVAHLLACLGEPAAVLAASEARLARIPGIGATLATVIHHWAEHFDLAAELALVERAGVSLLTRDDAEYPPLLREIHDPPLCLYVRGDRAVLGRTRNALAIVGSRHTTPYGMSMAQTLAAAAALAGWTVVSGLARGIDTAAHRAVVELGACTVAVLGSGLARLYPQENVDLARRIVETGGILCSEFPMRSAPDKRGFPMRNRIIAGMTLGTLVVEAGTQSGSLITANAALEQGRQVFAVPGRVDSPQSRGCHALIKDGAKLVETFADVLSEFSGQLPLAAAPPACTAAADAPAAAAAGVAALSPLEQVITERLAQDGESAIDDLIVRTGEPAARVLGALVTLEMRHLVSQLPGRRVALRRVQG
jgi:DNA processing protein